MDMIRATILEGGLDDIFWPKIVLAMIYIKNLRPMQVLKRSISPVKMKDTDLSNKDLSNLQYLYVLGLTVYVFLYKEKRILKLAK